MSGHCKNLLKQVKMKKDLIDTSRHCKQTVTTTTKSVTYYYVFKHHYLQYIFLLNLYTKSYIETVNNIDFGNQQTTFKNVLIKIPTSTTF